MNYDFRGKIGEEAGLPAVGSAKAGCHFVFPSRPCCSKAPAATIRPFVPWSISPLVLLRPTRYSLRVAVISTSTSDLSRSAREARYSDCRISSFVTRLACATARRMALRVPIRSGEWFGTDSR